MLVVLLSLCLRGLFASDCYIENDGSAVSLAERLLNECNNDTENLFLTGFALKDDTEFEIFPKLKSVHYENSPETADFEGLKTGTENIATIKLKNMGLTEVEFRGEHKVETLDLSDNCLSVLPRSLFIQTPELRYLYIQGNNIKVLDFSGYPFSKISLEHIGLTTTENAILLTEKLAQKFQGLTSLEVHGSFVGQKEKIDHVSEIMEFSMQNGQLIRVPEFSTNSITILRLDYNEIKLLKAGDFASLPLLETISLTHNKINAIIVGKDDLLKNSMLTEIDLSNNELQMLSIDAFRQFQNLKVIRADDNKIAMVTQNYDVANIKELSLRNNRLINLHASLKSLRTLDLTGNCFTQLTNTFWKDHRLLTDFMILGNNLSSFVFDDLFDQPPFRLSVHFSVKANIGDAIEQLYKIGGALDLKIDGLNHPKQKLEVRNCKAGFVTIINAGLTQIPEFSNHFISSLNLTNNEITYIQETDLFSMQKLEVLVIRNNKLVGLEKTAFRIPRNLEFIDLSSNLLTNIDKDLFKNNLKLTQVYLAHNKLHSIDLAAVFSHLPKLKFIDLGHNSIDELSDEVNQSSFKSNSISIRLKGNSLPYTAYAELKNRLFSICTRPFLI